MVQIEIGDFANIKILEFLHRSTTRYGYVSIKMLLIHTLLYMNILDNPYLDYSLLRLWFKGTPPPLSDVFDERVDRNL